MLVVRKPSGLGDGVRGGEIGCVEVCESKQLSHDRRQHSDGMQRCRYRRCGAEEMRIDMDY